MEMRHNIGSTFSLSHNEPRVCQTVKPAWPARLLLLITPLPSPVLLEKSSGDKVVDIIIRQKLAIITEKPKERLEFSHVWLLGFLNSFFPPPLP